MSKKTETENVYSKTIIPRRTDAVSRQLFGYAEKKWITCGATQVLVRVPTAKELNKRVDEANAAVKGLVRALAKRRVKMSFKPTTPLFQSDPVDPRIVIRTLNKKKSRGTFVNGNFVEMM